MPSTSRIKAAQGGLKGVIDGRAALADVPRTLGWPLSGPQTPEHIWIAGDVEAWTKDWLTTGPNGAAVERFTLKVLIVVEGVDYTTVRDRAFTLAAEVEEAVRADQTLGGTVDYAEDRGGEAEEGVRDNGRQFKLELDIYCEADLTA